MNITVEPKLKVPHIQTILYKYYKYLSHSEVQFLPGDLKLDLIRQFAPNVLSY